MVRLHPGRPDREQDPIHAACWRDAPTRVYKHERMKGPNARRPKLRPEAQADARVATDPRASKSTARETATTSLPASPRTLAPRLPWVPFSDLAGALRQDD